LEESIATFDQREIYLHASDIPDILWDEIPTRAFNCPY